MSVCSAVDELDKIASTKSKVRKDTGVNCAFEYSWWFDSAEKRLQKSYKKINSKFGKR